ncbi:hypothetical protein B0T20DRAFT_422991 [Sordaria brevicollis]|uniref:Uncharacterized protein n=1 Tax=Sordaria brevicollis TaxID=83679 RepID=A0AAE0P333_SORBR|nr:hypothetical protein B0T20DRAFT_422991 [Sordaria brevicollis]
MTRKISFFLSVSYFSHRVPASCCLTPERRMLKEVSAWNHNAHGWEEVDKIRFNLDTNATDDIKHMFVRLHGQLNPERSSDRRPRIMYRSSSESDGRAEQDGGLVVGEAEKGIQFR